MYIGRLQLKGFKSFGGTHELPLSPGMTAIVGPNGSGKSNLLDALRWVLGDSHASKLRIARQGDLLFQGSISLPQAKDAEVSIQLREDTRLCTVRRRVLTDGATQVLVDNSRKNLTELDDVKRLWRLEGDRFAFIGQGEVAEVIQQRPAARRMQLESLFGIDVYRKRRMEAADRLEKTLEEHDRLRNFSAELAARRETIAPEVERAARAREFLDLLEESRRLLYYIRRARSETSLETFSEQLSALQRLKQRKAFWCRAWNTHLAFHEGRLSSFGQTRQNQVREMEESRAQLESFIRLGYGNSTSLLAAKRRLEQISEEREAHRERIDQLRKERQEMEKALKANSKELEEKKNQYAQIERQWKQQEEERLENRTAWEALNREKGQAEAEFEQLKAKMSVLGKSLYELKIKEQSTRELDPGKKIKKDQEALEKRHSDLLDAQEKTAVLYQNSYAQLQQLTADLQKKRRELSQLTARLSEVTDQAQVEMYPKPVQHVLSSSKLGRIKANPVAVIDAFSCPSELASAMEAYLGARQFWLLVQDMDEAGRCIDQLKANSMGRATFLPLERCKGRFPDTSFRLPSGVVGWGIKLIKPISKWLPALQHIMGDVLIVEEYQVGQGLLRQGFRCPVVTLDGDVFQPAGTISGGKNQKSGKAIELKSLLAKLELDVQDAQKSVQDLTNQFAQAERDEEEASRKKEEISLEIRKLSGERSALDAQKETFSREKERAKGERESITLSLREGGRQYLALCRQLRELGESADLQEGNEDLSLFRSLEGLKGEIAVAGERVRSCFALLDRMISELRVQEGEADQQEEEIQELENQMILDRTGLSRMGLRYQEVFLRRKALLEEMEEFGKKYENLNRLKERRTARLKTAELGAAHADNLLMVEEQKQRDLIRELEELISTWEEQYPYPGADGFCDQDPDELRKHIRELDRNLKSMGDVDMGVLSEDRNLRDRLAFLGEQLDDVRQAMSDLQHLIDDADRQAKGVFTDALEEIDRRFNDLFQRLFGGGDAHLELVEGDTLWDSGVDVVARPPGKHPQSITQLSGGEQSLSAISLLFASLEVAKCPIAVLDEVDAALDEVNLRRFADLAKENAKDRQIFVMTHRRVTMERADVLYGVTLSEPGLSQVIGVRVEDWA